MNTFTDQTKTMEDIQKAVNRLFTEISGRFATNPLTGTPEHPDVILTKTRDAMVAAVCNLKFPRRKKEHEFLRNLHAALIQYKGPGPEQLTS
jgi:hypothetical protein